MKILLSNDDGVHAEGIIALTQAMQGFGDTVIMAPDRNRSGASNALTLSKPLRVRMLEDQRYSVEGTPTDCVHLALTGFLSEKIDLVVSGFNHGANLGDDVLYSGTVAAAIEACNMGYAAIAFSMAGHTHTVQHFNTGIAVAQFIVKKLLDTQLPAKTLLNVNIPDIPYEDLQGYHVTRTGARSGAEPVIESFDPRGLPMYWVGAAGPEEDAGPGTDFYAVRHGYVSVTPLHLDMTHYAVFDNIAHWFERSLSSEASQSDAVIS